MPNMTKSSALRISVVILFVLLTISGIAFSLYLIYFGAHTLVMYVIAAAFLILSAVSGFFNIFTSYSYYRSGFYDEYLEGITKSLKPLSGRPHVALVMPVYNEDAGTVQRNMLRLMTMNYPSDRMSFYLLDDSTDGNTAKQLRSFADSNGIMYLHRDDRKGFKAGALNNMLKHSKEEFMAVFDYDEYLTDQNFLLDVLPYFSDKRLSYIQTEKRYFKGTFFSDTVDLFDAFFFKFIQPSRALNNTAIFAGSCGLLRRSAVDKVGGFPEYIIEDTFFSFESDMHDFSSLYLPKVYAYGKPILTFTDLAKQQWRYNYGDTQFLMYFIRRLRSSKSGKKRSMMSTVDYITHGAGLNYISIVLILFAMISVAVVFAATSPSSVTIQQLLQAKYIATTIEILGISTFVISILAPTIMTKIHFKSLRKGFMVFLLNFALSFIRTKAAIAASLDMYPSLGWSKGGKAPGIRGRTLHTIRTTLSETTFSSTLFILGFLALIINNIYGAVWLIWYAMLYSTTFILFYKYG
ncbi:MAG: glycosyltransferase [Candidatus Micrarchaeaceae archaeon]